MKINTKNQITFKPKLCLNFSRYLDLDTYNKILIYTYIYYYINNKIIYEIFIFSYHISKCDTYITWYSFRKK